MRDELSIDDIALITAKELWPGKDATEQNAGLIASAIRGAIASCRPARLAAELAESVRALAVSQGEVLLARQLAEGALDVQAEAETRMFALRGDLERARGLAKRLVVGVEVHDGCACILCGFARFLAETAPPGRR